MIGDLDGGFMGASGFDRKLGALQDRGHRIDSPVLRGSARTLLGKAFSDVLQ